MMTNRHAYLIMAHNNFEQLKKLVECIDYKDNDIYIHIDKKVKNIDYNNIEKNVVYSKIYWINKRINVKWGDYSQVKCEMLLLKKAFEKKYLYYHLISGSDMLLKKPEIINEFFEKNKGKEFLHFESSAQNKEYIDRISKYYFFVGRNKNIVKKILYKSILFFQKPSNRKVNNLVVLKGANWCSITNDFVKYLIDNEKYIKHIFNHTLNPDEIFMQTMLINSKFKERLYYNKFDNNYESIMYCIDWKRGNPYEFTMDDYDYLINSKMLFARKFNWNKDKNIIEKLYNNIKNGEI